MTFKQFKCRFSSMVSTTSYDISSRLFQLNSLGLVSCVQGYDQLCWGTKDQVKLWTLVPHTFVRETRAHVVVEATTQDLVLPQLPPPPPSPVPTSDDQKTSCHPQVSSEQGSCSSDLSLPSTLPTETSDTTRGKGIGKVTETNITLDDPKHPNPSKKRPRRTATRRKKRMRIEHTKVVLEEDKPPVIVQPWTDLNGNLNCDILSVFTNTITKTLLDSPGISEENLFRKFHTFRPAVLHQVLYTLQLQGVIYVQMLMDVQPVSLFSKGHSFPFVVEKFSCDDFQPQLPPNSQRLYFPTPDCVRQLSTLSTKVRPIHLLDHLDKKKRDLGQLMD
eukprot:TRINITY_DN8865_c0_g1_i3.p1 TRINITY_DN8865_c0_g1~~TRINITY_DN8865_c0_g1_i3.p1  ORF type:complete len:332 (-),score=70.32 TRINITY_DN8865_c0_g1_i3:124-1119(-)